MVVSLLKRLLGKPEAPAKPVVPAPAKPEAPRKLSRQVYEGKLPEMAEFAKELDAAQLVKACTERLVCKFTPRLERQRLYRTGAKPETPGGDLPIEYEGIAVSCSAISEHGEAIGLEDGQRRAYRYADLNHVLARCCGEPTKCPFYRASMAERERVGKKLG